jgi:hypothetical protein
MKLLASAILMLALTPFGTPSHARGTASSSFVPRTSQEPHATLSQKHHASQGSHHAGGHATSHKGAHHVNRPAADPYYTPQPAR